MVCGSYLKNEERATGKQLCDTLTVIPSLAAPMIAAVLIANFGGLTAEGIRPLYFLQAIGFSVSLIWIYRFYFDTLKRKTFKNPNFIKDMKKVFERGTAVKSFILFYSLSSYTWYVSWIYIAPYISEVKLGDEFVVGSMTTASLVTPLLLALIVGRLADTFGRKKTLYVTISLYCLSILLLIYSENITMIIISGVLQGFLLLSLVTEGAISADLLPISLLGRWYGILTFFRGVGAITGPIIGGLIWSSLGPNYVLLTIIFIEASKMFILRFAIPETLRMKQSLD